MAIHNLTGELCKDRTDSVMGSFLSAGAMNGSPTDTCAISVGAGFIPPAQERTRYAKSVLGIFNQTPTNPSLRFDGLNRRIQRRLRTLVLGLLLLSVTTVIAQDTPEVYEGATISLISPALVSPFHVALQDGVVEQAQAFGWDIITRAPQRETDFEGQVAMVEQVVQQNVDVISVVPISSEAMITGVLAANDAGVPIMMHNTITPVSDGEVVEYIGYDQWGGAANLAVYVCQLLAERADGDVSGAEGQVYILTGIPGFHANRRTGGFEHGLSNTCPNVEVVGAQTAEWEREKGLQLALIALQQNPDIDVFFGNSDEMAIGACLAADQLGLNINEEIFCVGIDGNDVTLDLIAEGEMTATLGVYPRRMGAVVVGQMNKFLLGEAIPQVLLTPSVVVDINNLEAYVSGTTWVDPVAGTPEFDNGLPTVPE